VYYDRAACKWKARSTQENGGAVKTAGEDKSTAIWLAVLLLGTGWILDRIYLSNREDKHD